MRIKASTGMVLALFVASMLTTAFNGAYELTRPLDTTSDTHDFSPSVGEPVGFVVISDDFEDGDISNWEIYDFKAKQHSTIGAVEASVSNAYEGDYSLLIQTRDNTPWHRISVYKQRPLNEDEWYIIEVNFYVDNVTRIGDGSMDFCFNKYVPKGDGTFTRYEMALCWRTDCLTKISYWAYWGSDEQWHALKQMTLQSKRWYDLTLKASLGEDAYYEYFKLDNTVYRMPFKTCVHSKGYSWGDTMYVDFQIENFGGGDSLLVLYDNVNVFTEYEYIKKYFK